MVVSEWRMDLHITVIVVQLRTDPSLLKALQQYIVLSLFLALNIEIEPLE